MKSRAVWWFCGDLGAFGGGILYLRFLWELGGETGRRVGGWLSGWGAGEVERMGAAFGLRFLVCLGEKRPRIGVCGRFIKGDPLNLFFYFKFPCTIITIRMWIRWAAYTFRFYSWINGLSKYFIFY